MRDNYENCLAITLKWEGGDVNHPADPGGKTRWGITQATYDTYRKAHSLAKKSVFAMTKVEMLAIYKTAYWDTVSGDTLAPGVDLATWDYGVNSGPAHARKTLLASIGGSDVSTVKRICAKRMSFVKGLKTWKTFGKGWSRRIADIEARGVKMALSATTSAASVKTAMKVEADKAVSAAKAKGNLATTAGTGVGATAATNTAAPVDQWVSLGLLGLMGALAVTALVLIYRARHDKERAAAYVKVAEE